MPERPTPERSTPDRPVPEPRPTGRRDRVPASLQRARRRQERRQDRQDRQESRPAGTPEPAARETTDDRQSPGRRVLHALVHPGRGQVLAALILFVVGLGGVMQIRASTADDAYTSARREDLVQLLDGLTEEQRRLEKEIGDLQTTRDGLESGADRQQLAQQEAAKRIEALSILAGTVPAEGTGIRITIIDPDGKVTANVLLDAVEEMRDAGAEATEFNDTARVVASSSFADGPDGVSVDGITLDSPITVEVIGDSHSLAEAASFRGGLVSEIEGPSVGGQATVTEIEDVRIDSLHSVPRHQYAQPAPDATGAPTPR